MKKGYAYLLASVLLGVFVMLPTGCAWRASGYSRYPYFYGSYYWYPYGSYYGGPSIYDYYWYPYGGYYWSPYRSYHYRDYRYHYRPGDRRDDGHRIGRPRPPQNPPPARNPYPLKPPRPKGEQRPSFDRPFLRHDLPKR